MTLPTALGRMVDERGDWFAHLDERLPVALLRHVAESGRTDLGAALSSIMDIAARRTAVPAPAALRPHRRRAVVEPRVLPADVGRRFIAELRELVTGDGRTHEAHRERLRTCLTVAPDDARRVTLVLSEALAVVLDLPEPVSRAGLAVAFTALGESGWEAWCGPSAPAVSIPRQREFRQPDAPPPSLRDAGPGAFTPRTSA